MRHLLPILALLLSFPLIAAGPTGLLNDTGQALCYNAVYSVACTEDNVGDSGIAPRQDGRFGRDKAGMIKIGAGVAGFDFTKICWNGDAEGSATCIGALVANTTATATATPGTDWACTRDNVTNLIWSLQTVSDINWADATSTAGGSPIDTANAASRCGFNTGWRVPTRRELLNIVHRGASSSTIDTTFFSEAVTDRYWSSETYTPVAAVAWGVNFYDGGTDALSKTDTFHVRLVRSGQ